MKWIYHGSTVGNLKTIEPRVSNHGKVYVYGVLNRLDALWYCVDFKGFHQLADENLKMDENKVRKHYAGKSGYIYLLEKADFIFNNNINHWVSTKPVRVVHCEKVDDIFVEMSASQNFFDLSLEKIK